MFPGMEPESPESKFLEALRQGVDYRIKVKVRGATLYMRPLSMTETVQVTARVKRLVAQIPESERTELHEKTILAKETLLFATTSDVGAGDPALSDRVLDAMTPEEVQALFREYVAVVDKCNPSLDALTPEQLKNIVELVKKSPQSEQASLLTELSFSQLANAFLSLIRGELQQDKSLGG
jgi:hypothetical protein